MCLGTHLILLKIQKSNEVKGASELPSHRWFSPLIKEVYL